MVECRFTLELTKNGIQKSVYAKTGEVNSRMLVVTLTQNGKVYDLEEHTAVVFLETGENFSAEIVNNTVQAVIPDAFSEPQVRICELRISKGDMVLYSPKFEIVFEESYGNKAESESLGNGVKYVLWDEFEESVKQLEDDRHNHENKNTLDKLTTSEDGELLYNGESIGGRKVKTFEIENPALLIGDSYISGMKTVYTYNELPICDVEVKRIRFVLFDGEEVCLETVKRDYHEPRVVIYGRVVNSPTFGTLLACAMFPAYYDGAFDDLTFPSKMYIDYYEN